MADRSRWSRAVFFLMLVFMLTALGLYAFLGTFTRYMADDYFTAASLKNEGFWGSQIFWWRNWSGRYSFTFLISLVELFGLRLVPVLPALIILLWVSAIVYVSLPFLRALQIDDYPYAGIVLACAALWLTYRSFDDYPQIVFWQTGILTYPISPILFLFGSGIVIRRAATVVRIRWLEWLVWFLAAFIAGGFSETGVVIQIVLVTLFLITVIVLKIEQKRILTFILLAVLSGSLLSALVMAAAPGTLVRSGGYRQLPALELSLLGSFKDAVLFIPRFIENHTLISLFGFLVGAFVMYFCISGENRFTKASLLKHFAASLVLAGAGIWAGILPAYLVRGAVPPERALLFSNFLTSCLLIDWGAIAALLLVSSLPRATRIFQAWVSVGLLVFVIVWRVVPIVISQLQLITPLREYSTLWDERHRSLLAASQNGESIIITEDFMKVEGLRKLRTKLWLMGDFETSADYWINQGAAQYYEVDQIIAK